MDAQTLHPRFAVQVFSGQADWDWVKRLVEVFPGPVIGSGDVVAPEQPRPAGRNRLRRDHDRPGAMGNPSIFRQTLDLLDGRPMFRPTLSDRLDTALRHAGMLKELWGLPKAAYMLRGVMMWYTRGLPNSAASVSRSARCGITTG